MAEAIAAPPVRERPILFAGRLVRAILADRKWQTRRIVRMDQLRVRLQRAVMSDFPISLVSPPRVAKAGVHRVKLNPHGAVSCIEPDLGLKPGEFDFQCPFVEGTTRNVGGKWCIEPTGEQRLWVRENAWIGGAGNFEADDCNLRDDKGRARIVSWDASSDDDGRRAARDYGVKLTPSIHMPRWVSRISLAVNRVRLERLQDITEADARAEGIEASSAENARAIFAALWQELNGKRAPWASNPWVWVVEFRRVK